MATNADLTWLLEDVRSRLPRYTLYREYDEGNHRLLFATEKFRNTFGDLFQEFADNFCDDVVDGMVDRTQLVNWSANDTALAGLAQELWERSQGEARSSATFRHGYREGDGFTIVQTDPEGLSRVYKQNPATMAIRYDPEAPDEIQVAGKVWKAGKRYRANLYYPDRIERYASRSLGTDGGIPQVGAFRPLEDPGVEAVERVDGLPVFHYPNGELSTYGRSLLAGVIPLQDALNKSYADMLVTMEGTAAPLRWATGVQVERDPVTGEERDPFKGAAAKPGGILRVGSATARLGQFDAAEMVGFLDVQDALKIEIARKGYLPPHSITLRSGNAQAPSGISLLVSEGRTIKLAKTRQRDWGVEKRREMAYAIRLELGTKDVNPRDLTPEWAPAETRDELALLETLALKASLGVPRRELLIEAGYDPTDVDKWLQQSAEDDAARAALDFVLTGGRLSAPPTVAGSLQPPPSGPAGAPQPAQV